MYVHLEEYNCSTKKYNANNIHELISKLKITNKIYYPESTFHTKSFPFCPELPLVDIYFYRLI